MVESFDVFDTLLTRCVWQPSDLFLLVGRHLCDCGLVASAEEFQRERKAAEIRAREICSHEEITITDVYDVLAKSFGWTRDTIQKTIILEMECEKRALVPVATLRRDYEYACQRGKKVLCISDTYLPADFVFEQLKNHFPINRSNLYASSEVRLTKHSGKLFSHVSAMETITYDQWHHRGDNPHSDFQMPRKLGIVSQLLTQSSTRYEKLVANSSNDVLAKVLSGCMRATRLGCAFDTPHYRNIWNLASNVIAPAFFGFCYWLLSSAFHDDVKRLYFVSRDGQILLRISKTIQDFVPEFRCIECRYLYGSRQAWHLPSVFHIDSDTLNWIFADTSFLSVDVILERLGSNDHDLSMPAFHALCACIPKDKWSGNLSGSDRVRLRSLFEKNMDIRKWIIKRAEQARRNVLGYLKQEGLMDGTRWAMVDIGWGGNLQNSLSRILRSLDNGMNQSVRGYYWGLKNKSPYHLEDKQISFADEVPDQWKHVMFYNAGLYETFACADHGGTVGYYKTSEGWEPVLRASNEMELKNWGVFQLQKAAVDFTRHLLNNWSWELPIKEYMLLVVPILKQFFFDPTVQEVNCLESRPMYECQTEAEKLSLAPGGKSGRKIMLNWLTGRRIVEHGVWLHAIVAKESFFLRKLLKFLFLCRNIITSAKRSYGTVWGMK